MGQFLLFLISMLGVEGVKYLLSDAISPLEQKKLDIMKEQQQSEIAASTQVRKEEQSRSDMMEKRMLQSQQVGAHRDIDMQKNEALRRAGVKQEVAANMYNPNVSEEGAVRGRVNLGMILGTLG